jgi:hypothetical protein
MLWNIAFIKPSLTGWFVFSNINIRYFYFSFVDTENDNEHTENDDTTGVFKLAATTADSHIQLSLLAATTYAFKAWLSMTINGHTILIF